MSETPVPIHIFREQARLTEKALAERDDARARIDQQQGLMAKLQWRMHERAEECDELRERLAAVERERNSALDQCTALHRRLAARDELLRECPGYMEHDDARCEHFEKCQCGLTDLLQRIAAALGEAG